jgi:hypothetical protein
MQSRLFLEVPTKGSAPGPYSCAAPVERRALLDRKCAFRDDLFPPNEYVQVLVLGLTPYDDGSSYVNINIRL